MGIRYLGDIIKNIICINNSQSQSNASRCVPLYIRMCIRLLLFAFCACNVVTLCQLFRYSLRGVRTDTLFMYL